MKEETVEKLAWGIMAFIMLLIFAMAVLVGWGFIQLILWLTSK